MTKKVITDYTLCYPDPLVLKTGDKIKIFDEDTNEKWTGWHACEDSSGKKGWISETYFKKKKSNGLIIKDYNARELSVKKDAIVTMLFEDCGWVWCRDSCDNEGWLPIEILKK